MIRYHLEKAVYLATQGRPGPVWVDLPIDIQGMVIDEEELKRFDPGELSSVATAPEQRTPPAKSRGCLIFSNSRHVRLFWPEADPPCEGDQGIFGTGQPTEDSRAHQSPRRRSCTGRSSLFFGRPSTYGQRSANFIIQNCDLLISIGSRLSIPLIGRNTEAFARAARKVVVDIDPNELEKPTLKPDIPLPWMQGGSSKGCLSLLPASPSFLFALGGTLSGMAPEIPPDSYTGPSLPSDPPEDGLIYPLPLLRILSAELGENDVVVADGGRP